MAKIGFEYIVAGKLNTDVSVSKETATYTEAREIGPGANFTGTPTSNDVYSRKLKSLEFPIFFSIIFYCFTSAYLS